MDSDRLIVKVEDSDTYSNATAPHFDSEELKLQVKVTTPADLSPLETKYSFSVTAHPWASSAKGASKASPFMSSVLKVPDIGRHGRTLP